MINSNKNYVNMFGKNVIVDSYKFTVTIHKMNKLIAIEVTDQSLRSKQFINF